jgi:prepilin-type N-terminal cleavage/methylation domain-containing protein
MRTVRRQRAFTLIEVLIVVALVAILAATVIPRFASSTEDAKQSALEHDLRLMRSQIQAYEAQHFGDYPEIRNNALPQLTGATNVYGEIGTPGDEYPHGPYLEGALPVNPFDQSNQVTRVAVAGRKPLSSVGNLGGWQYDPSNGAIWPNHPEYYRLGQQSIGTEPLPSP